MKIVKLIAVFLVVFVQLKGSEEEPKIQLFMPIGKARCFLKPVIAYKKDKPITVYKDDEPVFVYKKYNRVIVYKKYKPVIIYKKYMLDDLQQEFEDSYIKCALQSKEDRVPKCLIISDVERQSGPKRSYLHIKIGEEINPNPDNKFTLNAGNQYQNNTITEMNLLTNDTLIEYLKEQVDLVVFNMYRTGSSELNNLYLNEIEMVMQKKVPVLIILGAEYKGVDIENWCVCKGIEPIVYNKPTIKDISWWKDHERELMLGGLFVGVILSYGILCYVQFVR